MSHRVQQGELVGVRQLASPNADLRPPEAVIRLIVVHGISLPPEQFGHDYIDALFTNTLDSSVHPYFATIADLRVSAHLLIRRDGSLTQYVNFAKRAWHAGVSCYQGQARCNDFAIGIELEGSDHQPYETAQYQALASVCVALFEAYPALSPREIVGHSDIAPERKTDPGPHFLWPRFYRELSTQLASASSISS